MNVLVASISALSLHNTLWQIIKNEVDEHPIHTYLHLHLLFLLALLILPQSVERINLLLDPRLVVRHLVDVTLLDVFDQRKQAALMGQPAIYSRKVLLYLFVHLRLNVV